MDAQLQRTVEGIEQLFGPEVVLQVLSDGLESYLGRVKGFSAELRTHFGTLAEELWAVAQAADPNADLSFEAKGDGLKLNIRGNLGAGFPATLSKELERIASSRPELRKLLTGVVCVIDTGEWATTRGENVDA